MDAQVRAEQIGARAAGALKASGGWVAPLADWPDAPYADAAGDIVWLGRRPSTEHPRMVRGDVVLPLRAPLRIDVSAATLWQPPVERAGPAAIRAALERVCRDPAGLTPRGLAAPLIGELPPFPLTPGLPRLRALAAAYASGDAARIIAASTALLGFGTGLTPSGDDAVGGALFGARLMGQDVATLHAGIAAAAAQRTHRLSAALLDDLAAGRSYGALHQAVAALSTDARSGRAAVRALGDIGHSSGWDMFAGLIIAVLPDVMAALLDALPSGQPAR